MYRPTNHKDIYIGRIIQQKLDESKMPYAEFASRIHSARTSIYRIFECKSIDIERLITISDVLNYDFVHEIYFADEDASRQKNATDTTDKTATEETATDTDSLPSITLPIRNGHIVADGLPADIREYIIRELKG